MKINGLKSAFTALFAALICIGTFISIPMGSIPITIQNMFVILSGLILGGVSGCGATGIFIILGIIGLPVFSGCHGGLAYFRGPTGGFLIGYFIASLVAGIIAGTPSVHEKKFGWQTILRISLAAAAGFILIYVPGIPWFINVMAQKGKTFSTAAALSVCVVPYIPGDLIKLAVSIPLALTLRPVAAKYLYPDEEKESEELLESIKSKQEKK